MPSSSLYVDLGPKAYRAMWWLLLFMHVQCAVYYLTTAGFYCVIRLRPEMLRDLGAFSLRLSVGHSVIDAAIISHLAFAAIHAQYLMSMLLSSVRAGRLAFHSALTRSNTARPAPDSRLRRIQAMIFDNHAGLMGVNNPHTELVFFVRSTLGLIFQTRYALRLSRYIPRKAINRLYMSMHVFDCWWSPAQQISNMPRTYQRLAALVVDTLADFTTIVVMQFGLGYAYAMDCLTTSESRWYRESWFVQITNETEVLLIVSAGDLTCRIIFSLVLVCNLHSLRASVRDARTVLGPDLAASAVFSAKPLIAVTPNGLPIPQSQLHALVSASGRPLWPRTASTNGTNLRIRSTVTLYEALRRVFVLWGIVVLITHLQAFQFGRDTAMCPYQEFPWLQTKAASCSLVEMNCHGIESEGYAASLVEKWEHVYPKTVSFLTFINCPHLEMPHMVATAFTELKGFKVINSSIFEWDVRSVPLPPSCVLLFFENVTFVDHQISIALFAASFPSTLRALGFYKTNIKDVLITMADNTWPARLRVWLDVLGLDHVPLSVLKSQPEALSLVGNELHSLPTELFTSPGLREVALGLNPLTTVANSEGVSETSFVLVDFSGSALIELPAWMAANASIAVKATGTPLCATPPIEVACTLVCSATLPQKYDSILRWERVSQ